MWYNLYFPERVTWGEHRKLCNIYQLKIYDDHGGTLTLKYFLN